MLDTQQMQGNMQAMFAHHNFGVMSGAINQLGSQVWMTIAALQTSQDERDLAYETARLRTANSLQVMNQTMIKFMEEQESTKRSLEAWARSVNDDRATHDARIKELVEVSDGY